MAADVHNFGDGCYPLHAACREGNAQLVKFLISNGHLVNQPDFDLVQPLHEACAWGRIDCVHILLRHGANVNGRNIDSATPLCEASSAGNDECVKILLKHGAHVNPPLLLTSPLHEAALRDQWKCCHLLVEAGASLNHTDCHFGTPLHAAIWKGRINCAIVLLKAGCNVNAVKVLSTPLHCAARQEDCSLLELLLYFGADVYARDNAGRRASDLSLTSPPKLLLQTWEVNPRSLKLTCKLTIRRWLTSERLKLLDKLSLPKLLYNYLTYSDITVDTMETGR